MRQWHLILEPPQDGVYNMAVDEALLTSAAAGEVPPTLRLYAWSGPWLSLGYAQSIHDVDLTRLDTLGWGLVRRITGGRAICHADELTYSLVLPSTDLLASGGIVESYRRLSKALLTGLSALALDLQADKKAEGAVLDGAVCFEATSHYEVTTSDKRKLIGSAQTRRRDGLLQHGTLPLEGDIARICEALTYPDEPARDAARLAVRARAATLADALGAAVSWERAADMIVQGFADTFDVDFTLVEITDAQRAHAARLAREVYRSAAWTNRL